MLKADKNQRAKDRFKELIQSITVINKGFKVESKKKGGEKWLI